MDFIGHMQEYLKAARVGGREIRQITIDVTERYARKRLGIKKSNPLTYDDIPLRCIGSRGWRLRNAPPEAIVDIEFVGRSVK